jgi:hypothetical protein
LTIHAKGLFGLSGSVINVVSRWVVIIGIFEESGGKNLNKKKIEKKIKN